MSRSTDRFTGGCLCWSDGTTAIVTPRVAQTAEPQKRR